MTHFASTTTRRDDRWFGWAVHRYDYGKRTETAAQGREPTRSKATTQGHKALMRLTAEQKG